MRGFFNDPRVQGASHAFHFGIDVSAPDGTPVYAVTPGKVFIEDHGHAVAVQAPDGRAFGYWHVKPAVAHHQQVRLHQLLGHIEAGWGHVHFAESIKGRYLDPIRPGALHPFTDVGHPTIAQIMFRRGKTELKPDRIKGRVQICCVAYDTTPIHVPKPWSHMPVAPARLRYRVMCAGRCVQPLKPGVDLRVFRKPDVFHAVYAPDTRQNHPNKPGRYTLHPRPRVEHRGVRERRLPARGAGLGPAREPRHLRARVQDPQLTVRRSRSGSTTTCSRWNAPIGLSLRPCTFGRRSTSWREYEIGAIAARSPIQTRSNWR